MFAFRRAITYPYTALVVITVGVLAVVPAQSRSSTRAEQTVGCSARVAELEAEVRGLRERIQQLSGAQHDSLTAAYRGSHAHSSGANQARTMSEQQSTTRAQPETCDPPFSFDRRGIKYYKTDCLKPEAQIVPCAIPFEFTAGGIKVYDPNCFETSPAQASCDPPYAFDGRGVKSYKLECLR